MLDPTKPFPFPDGYWLDMTHKLVDRSIRDYIRIFERRRNERPGGKFVSADIVEIMRLAELLGIVHSTQIACIRELVKTHPDYFQDQPQMEQLTRFANNHEARHTASDNDDFVEDVLRIAPFTLFRELAGMDFIVKAQALSAAVKASDAFFKTNAVYDPRLVEKVNAIAGELGQFVEGLTLSDVDKPGREAHDVYWRDVANLLARPSGETHHESEWREGKWVNWNRDVTVYPTLYGEPRDRVELKNFLTQEGPFRMVAGGHAFNISSSMGGVKIRPFGTLVTLDKYRLDGGALWIRLDANDAVAKYHVSPDQASRVVRVSAGMRLRDFGKAMWKEGMALPVAGSTDAQSLGGLVASDLHGTGLTRGFLSSQLLEVTVLSGNAQPVTFTKDESVSRGQIGRWKWTPPGQNVQELLARLPVSGALGMTGVVYEVVLKLDEKFNLRKREQFVPREWAESNIERLLNPAETDPIFAYDHVSFYYGGGGNDPIKTVRMNTWKRTTDELSRDGDSFKTIREIFDLIGSGFLPDYLLRLARVQSSTPGQPPAPGDDGGLSTLNKRKSLVLPANEAFARKLFFQHDEIEVGIPLPLKSDGNINYDVFRNAIQDTLRLLSDAEFKTIIEVRFTPDLSEAMLGPGAGGPTCYIELATPLGELSRARIVQVYDLFDRLMREKYRARPHLGKKTSVTYQDMEALYSVVWDDFQNVRSKIDPANKFLPKDNVLLNQIFRNPS